MVGPAKGHINYQKPEAKLIPTKRSKSQKLSKITLIESTNEKIYIYSKLS